MKFYQPGLIALVILFVMTLASVSNAQYPRVLEHTDPVVYFEDYQTVMPQKSFQEFFINVKILNAYQDVERRRIVGFQIDFRYSPQVLIFDEAVAPIPREGFFSAAVYEKNLTAGLNRRDRVWFQERLIHTHGLDTVYLDKGNFHRRPSGTLVRLKFRNIRILTPGVNPKVEFVRVQLFYDNGADKFYYEPNLSPEPNSIRVFNTRLVNQRSNGDVDYNGRVDNNDLRLLIDNYGAYLNRAFATWEPRDSIDRIRGMDLDKNWIIDGRDLRKLSCYIDNRKKYSACEFIFGRIKAQVKK